MGGNRPLTVEDFADDLQCYGPFYRAYAHTRISQFREAGLTGEMLSQAVTALEEARQAPGTGPFWRLLEEVRQYHIKYDG